MRIVWTNSAQVGLKKIYDYILDHHSAKNATKVINDLMHAVEKAKGNPEIYASDKLKSNNDGTYRAFEKHHIRISFRIHEEVIRVLRVRHTSRKPDKY
ncbi:MAG: type II toxin-antitoxin system RelE/ParE family toxin [Taibaiella sp.]|jgi:plasmid stabilization system protein ParE